VPNRAKKWVVRAKKEGVRAKKGGVRANMKYEGFFISDNF